MAATEKQTTRESRFVAVTTNLLARAAGMVERASVDKIAGQELIELLETAITLIDDHGNPKPRGYGYAAALVPPMGDAP